jgi:hypothetical protein
MKLDPGMHIGLHLVFFGKTGVTGEKNEPEPTQKRIRPVGPFGPAQPIFVAVWDPLCSVLSR